MIVKKIITVILLIQSLFTPTIYAEEGSMELLQDIQTWADIHLKGEMEPYEFAELIGHDMNTVLAAKGLLQFKAKNTLLKDGYLFFSTPEKNNADSFGLHFEEHATVTLHDFRRQFGRVERSSEIDDVNSVHHLTLEEDCYLYIGFLYVNTKTKQGSEKRIVTGFRISRLNK